MVNAGSKNDSGAFVITNTGQEEISKYINVIIWGPRVKDWLPSVMQL